MARAPRRPLVAGNWKMNGLRASAAELARIIQGARELAAVDLLVCPPATLACSVLRLPRTAAPVRIGAQDCHAEAAGAFTGDLSAEMLKDAGASAVIVGHSERRSYHRETDADVRAKALAARRAGLCAIVCVGETRAERDGGRALAVVGTQLDGSMPDGATGDNLVVAYEPVWAIGTGLTPTPDDVAEMHGFIRRRLASRFGAAGRGHAHPLWRLGEAFECQGAACASPTSMARSSAAPASRPTSSWRSRACTDRLAPAASYMTPGGPEGLRPQHRRDGPMQTVIIVIHLMVVATMIGVVLLQKSEGGGLGIGSTGGFLSSRGTSNVLTRTTAILAATFFATSLVLSILAGWDRKPQSIIQNTGAPAQQTPGAPLGQGAAGCSIRCASRSSHRRRRRRPPDRRCRSRNEVGVRGRVTGPFTLGSHADGEWTVESPHEVMPPCHDDVMRILPICAQRMDFPS